MKFQKRSVGAAVMAGMIFAAGAGAVVRVPPGFEELAEGQMLMLDVFLYGQSLGVYQARVDLDNVSFSHPAELIAAVKAHYNRSPQLLKQMTSSLNSPLKRNGNLACGTNGNRPGCDFLETDKVAVIYDENNAKLMLFLAPEFMSSKTVEDRFYQATPESKNALVHQQNLNFVADRDYQSASLQGNGSLGVTQNSYVNADWNWQGQKYRTANVQKAELNNVYYRYDLWQRMYLQGGMMDSRDIFSNAGGSINLSQLPIGKIAGVRVGSTLAWINMDKVSRGTPVSVLLSRDARIDAYRGSQLLSSFYLKAGTHELDTHSFPAGSYVVTLRIYESNQLARSETVPYTGTGGGPLNTFQWFLQGGRLRDNGSVRWSTDDDGRVFMGGLRLPITGALSLTAGATLLSDARYWEGAADWSHGFDGGLLDGTVTARASYLHGSDGSRGTNQQLNYNDGFSVSLFRSSMSAPDCNNQGERRYSYSGCYESTNIMLSVPYAQWNGSLGYADNSNEGRYVYRRELPDDDKNGRAGVPWEQVYQTRSRSRTWQVGVNRYFSVNAVNINAGINAFTRKDTGYNGRDKGLFVTLGLSRATGGGQTRNSASAGVSWQSSRRGDDQLGYNAAYSRYADDSGENELGASLNGLNTDSVNTSVYGRAGGQYGSGALTVSDSWDKSAGRHRPSSSGSYSSAVVIDGSGVLFGRWGDGTPSSAVTVDVQGDEQKVPGVSVSLDSAGHSEVSGSGRALFTVPGYRQTTFGVTESGSSTSGISSEISKGAGVGTVFMTPGKVFNRHVEITTHYTWLGRMMDTQQRPIEGGIPLNVASWTPLGGGMFTLETTRVLKNLYVMKNGEFWQCGMKVRKMRDVVRDVGTTVCERMDAARLPVAEQRQAELMAAGMKRDAVPTAMNE
ncbi:TcfC E-set like domain-containing protein [Serratia fonticola]|uniref:TcfC E-set like domain-containing protein n=1 Tax=Serratia fonticola TaxID=47917 RepID=UPI003AAACD37